MCCAKEWKIKCFYRALGVIIHVCGGGVGGGGGEEGFVNLKE